MRLLAFDTTLDVCSVALLEAGERRVLAERHMPMARGHAEALHPLICETMDEAQAGFKELNAIAVTCGPGTFTGCRIGIAAARGFALTLDVKIFAISSLQALAANAFAIGETENPVLALLDARRGEVYAAAYTPDGEEILAPAALPVDGLEMSLPKRPLTVCGSGAQFLDFENPQLTLSAAESLPKASIWGFAAARLEPADGLPLPLYLRKPDAKPPAQGAVLQRATPN